MRAACLLERADRVPQGAFVFPQLCWRLDKGVCCVQGVPSPEPTDQEEDTGDGQGGKGQTPRKLSEPGRGKMDEVECADPAHYQQASPTFPAPAQAES